MHRKPEVHVYNIAVHEISHSLKPLGHYFAVTPFYFVLQHP
jgi:hypothetical protein